MNLNHDLKSVAATEFGVGRDDGDEQTFVAVPVDVEVQATLREMVEATWDAMQRDDEGPSKYEPSEKHASTEYLYLPLDDVMASSVRQLHEAANLDIDSAALADPTDLFCYYARLTDESGRRLTALRRATQFKGVVKSRGRLIRWMDDSLQVIEDTVFKLDWDFDLLVDSAAIHILRPSGFEFAGKLQQAILDAVPRNIEAVQKELDFVDFATIEGYASKHPRAARYLASIRSQQGAKDIDKAALKKLCSRTAVELEESGDKIIVPAGQEMGFLEVLDRRRYEVNLVKKEPERYRAASRRKING